jgi:hypothetical protein
MRLSLRWAERSKRAFGDPPGRALFGIVQGGDVRALRVELLRLAQVRGLHEGRRPEVLRAVDLRLAVGCLWHSPTILAAASSRIRQHWRGEEA